MASLVQLSYAISLAEHGSFLKAAKASFVTQPTLSMQVQKLEDELGVTLFDRSRKPITPTSTGVSILEQFRRVLAEYQRIEEILNQAKGEVSGDFRLGIIPTMAPYIMPLFLRSFVKKHPKVHLSIHEITTEEIVQNLKMGQLDAGILATPLNDPQIVEEALFNEPFCIYHSPDLDLGKEGQELSIRDLPLEHIVVMNEGHCLRNQVLDLCKLKEIGGTKGFAMETGSVTTLTRMIDQGPYFSILPQLCLEGMSKKKLARQVKHFKEGTPYREVGLVTYRREIKRAVTVALTEVLRQSLPTSLTTNPSRLKTGKLIPP